ncbi:MAG: hypothetical protein ACI4QX_05585 [Lachnospiraceae bacterium]
MRELRWNLWKLRWFFLVMVGFVVLFVWFFSVVLDAWNGFETGYRTAFIMLQLAFLMLQRERFNIVLRKESANRFYRSMPHAWEKEQRRFLWIDGFCMAGLLLLLAVGLVFQNEFLQKRVPISMFVFFFIYLLISRIFAAIPYIWWVPEVIFGIVFAAVPFVRIPVLFGVGIVIVFVVLQTFLYRYIKRLWYTEE